MINALDCARPVGVGEIVRRIIGKAVMVLTGEKVQQAVGALQLCAGQPAGVESAIHAMKGFLDDDESDGVLLIDAFNRVNRGVALEHSVHLSRYETYSYQVLSFTYTHFHEWRGIFRADVSGRHNARVSTCNGNVCSCTGTTLKAPATFLQASVVC